VEEVVMAEHDDIVTPYSRPIPQWEMKSSSPPDPTAGLLATGGFLQLNDRDRAGLNEWFKDSFRNQFQHKVSWFCTDWFPAFFAPIRNRINVKFNEAFDSLHKNDEEIVKLRKEMTGTEVKLRGEHAAEVVKLHNEIAGVRKALETADLNLGKALDSIRKNDEEVIRLRNEMAVEVGKMHKQMAAEVVKIHADVRHEMRDFIAGKNKEFKAEVGEMRKNMVTKCNDDLNVMRDDLLCVLRNEVTDVLLQSTSRPTSKPVSSKVNK